MRMNDFRKINDYEWELPTSYDQRMNVPVKVFCSRKLLENALFDKSIDQALNVSSLPGFIGWISVMADVHQGYGFPIGGVGAADIEKGIISPGGIGYDINCGVRLLRSKIPVEAVNEKIKELVNTIYTLCPSGLGIKGNLKISVSDLEELVTNGIGWALKNGYATQRDIDFTEDRGCLSGARIESISQRAFARGHHQIGTLGSGNHFIEIDVVDDIVNSQIASALGLIKGNIAIQIHTGSRGFGHQICVDYVNKFQYLLHEKKVILPDRELVYAPFNSDAGQRYLSAMRAAANYAYVNRQLLKYRVREAFETTLIKSVETIDLDLVYDLTHNIGKVETLSFKGDVITAFIHRKGATRAFGPNSEKIPKDYEKIGQPVLIPGSMGTSSWVLVGTREAENKSFGSCAHGAGRLLSRSQAKKKVWGEELLNDLNKIGIYVKTGSLAGLAEEAPIAYKNVDEVIESVIGAGLAKPVARLVPIAVVKG